MGHRKGPNQPNGLKQKNPSSKESRIFVNSNADSGRNESNEEEKGALAEQRKKVVFGEKKLIGENSSTGYSRLGKEKMETRNTGKGTQLAENGTNDRSLWENKLSNFGLGRVEMLFLTYKRNRSRRKLGLDADGNNLGPNTNCKPRTDMGWSVISHNVGDLQLLKENGGHSGGDDEQKKFATMVWTTKWRNRKNSAELIWKVAGRIRENSLEETSIKGQKQRRLEIEKRLQS